MGGINHFQMGGINHFQMGGINHFQMGGINHSQIIRWFVIVTTLLENVRFLVEYRIKSHIYSGFYIAIFDSRRVIRARNHLQSLEIHRRFQSVSTSSGEFPQKASHITKKSACNMLQLLVSYVSLSVYIYIYIHTICIYIYI